MCTVGIGVAIHRDMPNETAKGEHMKDIDMYWIIIATVSKAMDMDELDGFKASEVVSNVMPTINESKSLEEILDDIVTYRHRELEVRRV